MHNTVALTPDQKPGVEAGTGAPAPVLHDFRTFRQSDCSGDKKKKVVVLVVVLVVVSTGSHYIVGVVIVIVVVLVVVVVVAVVAP